MQAASHMRREGIGASELKGPVFTRDIQVALHGKSRLLVPAARSAGPGPIMARLGTVPIQFHCEPVLVWLPSVPRFNLHKETINLLNESHQPNLIFHRTIVQLPNCRGFKCKEVWT